MKLSWFGRILPEPNGCGPKGLQWAVPNLIFKPACNLHDNLFSARVGFFASNWAFYMRMRHYIKLTNNWYYEPIAVVYFIAVTLFGWPYYFRLGTKLTKLVKWLFHIK